MSYRRTSSIQPKVDSVKFVSQYLHAHNKRSKYKAQDKALRERLIHTWLQRYHTEGISEEEKELLVSKIVMGVWYLFPYVLRTKNFPSRVFEEVLQNMSLETIKAIKAFNPDLGFKFTSYIHGYLKNAIAKGVVDEVTGKQGSLQKTKQDTLQVLAHPDAQEATEQEEDESPTDGKTQIALSKIDHAQEDQEHDPCYLLTDEGELEYADDSPGYQHSIRVRITPEAEHEYASTGATSTEDSIANRELTALLEAALDKNSDILTEQERTVIQYRYGIFRAPRLTLEQISTIFHSCGWKGTKVWVHQIERRALGKLKDFFASAGIHDAGG